MTPIPDLTGAYGSNTALQSSTAYDYNTGLPTSTTDANSQTSYMEYNDALLRPTKVTAPNGHQTITEYGAGTSAATRYVKTRSQIDAEKWKEAYTWFDGLGRTIKTQSVDDDGDVFAETQYDNMGRAWKSTNPYRNGEIVYWTENTFDTAGRPWKVTTPDGAIVETTYSLAATSGYLLGTAVTVEDQADKQRRSITNALGQLVRVDEPTSTGTNLGNINTPNQPTTYGYDLLSNLISVQQNGTTSAQCGLTSPPCNQSRAFTYDSMSRLKSANNPESATTQYTYDPNSNLATKIDARGVKTTYTYDRLNRVTNRDYTLTGGTPPNYQSTPNVSYFYDNLSNAKGKLTKVTSGTGTDRSTTEYTGFDTMGRITAHRQTTDGTAYTTGYTYNLSGALIEQTYPSGRVVKNTLDSSGDLAMVQSKKNAASGYWSYADSFSYNSAGAVTSMQLGNGKWESTVFNSRLQPEQIALGTTVAATDNLKLNYVYGTSTTNNGNITSQTITVPGLAQPFVQNYGYDELNRISSATETHNGSTTWNQVFGYDRYGNRNVTSGTGVTSFSFTANKISSHSYDLAGNTTSDGTRTFTYDAESKQTAVDNGSTGQYFYDGDGKRVKKYVPGTGETTIFVYDAAGKLVAEYSTIVASAQDAKVAYLTNDHLGTPRINTDQNGAVTARHDYRPFGEEILTTQRTSAQSYVADTIRAQFTGYERDNESGLDFAEARMYVAALGRFISADNFLNDASAVEPASWNLYASVRNNPVNFIDPTGETVDVSRLSGSERKELLKRLNYTYGCDSCVTVDSGSRLRVDTANLSSEVVKAASYLTKAINEDKFLAVVEVKNHDADVAFGKSTIGGTSVPIKGTTNRRSATLIQLDFGDDAFVSGDRAAKESFLNTVFAHEVAHFMPDFQRDPESGSSRGAVVNRVNEIMLARGLPLRGSYYGSSGANSPFYTIAHGPASRKDGGIVRGKDGIEVKSDSKKAINWIKKSVGGRGIN